MNFKSIFNVGIIIISVFLIISCTNNYKGFEKNENGTYTKYHIISEEGETPVKGSIVIMDISYGTKDSIVFDSKKSNAPFKRELGDSEFTGDIYSCIYNMKAGDSATFIINADSFYLKTARQQIVPELFQEDKDLYMNLYLKEVMTREEAIEQAQKEVEALEQKEKDAIQAFLEEKQASLNADGIYYKEMVKGEGSKPKEGQMITVHYDVNILGGPLAFSTVQYGKPIDFEFGTEYDTQGFRLGIKNMRKGGKAEFMVPSALAFGNEGTQNRIAPYTAFVYNVEIIDILSKEELNNKIEEEKKAIQQEELSKIEVYLNENNLPLEPTTENGLYYFESVKGEGPQVKSGDAVLVHYTLYLLDGTVVDSSVERGVPFDVIVDQSSVIDGWHQGLKLMNVGSKAKLLIPSKLGYGDRKRSEEILPYTPLIFEMEVLEIKE